MSALTTAVAGFSAFPTDTGAVQRDPETGERKWPSLEEMMRSQPKPSWASPSRERPAQEKVVFFPPPAPAFGGALYEETSRFRFPEVEPPDGLGDFVGEFFYPPLSTRLTGGSARLWAGDLDAKLKERLAAYVATRQRLLGELQNEFVAVQNDDPITREAKLRAFAAVQTPRIVTLEKEADQIRKNLIDGGLLRSSIDWSKGRDWRVDDAAFLGRHDGVVAEFQVLRAAAYYQNGLSVEQRGMLVELAEEARARDPLLRSRLTISRDSDAGLYFLPETSRLRLPPLPQELSARIVAFTRAKEALKTELREKVIAHDRAPLAERDAAMQKLSESQWPAIATLAELAEEIRRGLVLIPAPPPPPLPPQIPAALVKRMAECQVEKAALARELAENIRGAAVFPGLLEFAKARRNGVGLNEMMGQAAAAQFRTENAERYQDLNRKIQSVVAELRFFASLHLDVETGRPMDVQGLLRHMNTSERYFDQIAREEVIYKDYRTAMLEPGLSPEQRRLLFGAARVALSQALPASERFPTGPRPRF